MSEPKDTAEQYALQAAIHGRLVILGLLVDLDPQRIREDAWQAFHFARLALEAH